MPATYLTSSVGPDQPIDNWLSWSKKDMKKSRMTTRSSLPS